MKLSKQRFQAFLDEVPPGVWAVIYTELKDHDAKLAMRATLFDEGGHARSMADYRVRTEMIALIAHYPEIRTILVKAAHKYYIKHSWRRWLPWNYWR